MNTDITGNQIHRSATFAQTDIGDLRLCRNLHNELEVRRDQILQAATDAELCQHHIYAKGVVRGLEVGCDITPGQALKLNEIYDAAQSHREMVLSDTGR
jgi:hypothetical protein